MDLEAGLLSIREVRTEVGGSVVLKSPRPAPPPGGWASPAPGPAAGAAAGVGEAAQRRPEGVGGAAAGRDAPKPDQLTRDLLTVVRRQGLPKISSTACGTALPRWPTARACPCSISPAPWGTAP
ncbi:MAG: hypothetical protein ACLTYN_12240 [Dysosmobacter welbionis]